MFWDPAIMTQFPGTTMDMWRRGHFSGVQTDRQWITLNARGFYGWDRKLERSCGYSL